jgi:hypothetical protein
VRSGGESGIYETLGSESSLSTKAALGQNFESTALSFKVSKEFASASRSSHGVHWASEAETR